MSCWILVINDTNSEFEKRIEEKKWPIFTFTPNRKKLKTGDRIIFYKAGIEGKKFLGTAKLNSDLNIETRLGYSISLTDIKIWKRPRSVEKLLDKLEFIRDRKAWGRFFQGGVIKINGKDYTIIANSK